MAEYPGGIYSPRTKENKAGIVYNAAKKTIGYVEDITKLDDEVVAIQIELGLNPKGPFNSVKEFLEALVPYTGAISDVNLGNQELATTNKGTFGSLKIGTLNGILKASAGSVSGLALLSDLLDVAVSTPGNDEILIYQADLSEFQNVILDLNAFRDSNWSRARFIKTSNQSIPTATWTIVNWQGIIYDNRSEVNLSTNRFTPDQSGYYLIVWQSRMQDQDSAGTAFHKRVLKGSGAVEIARNVFQAPATYNNLNVYTNLQAIVYLNATTDYIYFKVYQNSGGSRLYTGDAAGIWGRVDIHRLS